MRKTLKNKKDYASHLRSGQKPTRADSDGRTLIVVLYTGNAKLKFVTALRLQDLLFGCYNSEYACQNTCSGNPNSFCTTVGLAAVYDTFNYSPSWNTNCFYFVLFVSIRFANFFYVRTQQTNCKILEKTTDQPEYDTKAGLLLWVRTSSSAGFAGGDEVYRSGIDLGCSVGDGI